MDARVSERLCQTFDLCVQWLCKAAADQLDAAWVHRLLALEMQTKTLQCSEFA